MLSCLQKDRIHTLYPTPHTAWTRLHPTATPSLTNSREHPKRHARNKQEIWWHIVFRKNHSGKAGKLQTLQQLSGSNYPGFRDPQPATRPERTSAPHMFSDSNSNKSSAYQPRHHHAILFIITSTPLGVMPIDEDTHFSYARFAVATPTAMSNSFP